MTDEDHQAVPVPGTGNNTFFRQLQERASGHANLTLQDLKPLIDDALIFLKTVTDFASKKVADALNTLHFVPNVLMNEKFSSILEIDPTKHSFINYKVGKYLLLNDFHKKIVHIAGLLHESTSVTTTKALEAQCQYNLFLLYRLVLHYTFVYPMNDASFCRSVCTEGILDILKLALIYFDDPGNILPVTVDGYNLTIWTKLQILGVLLNCIALCSENKNLYQQAKITETLSKIDRNNEDVKLVVLLIVAYTVDEIQPKEIFSNSEETVKYLMELLKRAMHSANHLCSTGIFIFSSRYLLDGLYILSSNNDANKLAILKHGGILAIVRMLRSDFSEDEIQLATKTLQNLAVVKKIRREIEAQLYKSGNYDNIVPFYILV